MWKLNDSSEETARDRLQRKTHCDRKIQANLKMIKSLEYLTKEVTQTTSTRDGCQEQLVALCKLSSASTTTAHLLESLNQMDTDRKCCWVCGATGTLIHYPWKWKTTDTVWKTGRYCVISTYTCHLTKESHCVCVRCMSPPTLHRIKCEGSYRNCTYSFVETLLIITSNKKRAQIPFLDNE